MEWGRNVPLRQILVRMNKKNKIHLDQYNVYTHTHTHTYIYIFLFILTSIRRRGTLRPHSMLRIFFQQARNFSSFFELCFSSYSLGAMSNYVYHFRGNPNMVLYYVPDKYLHTFFHPCTACKIYIYIFIYLFDSGLYIVLTSLVH